MKCTFSRPFEKSSGVLVWGRCWGLTRLLQNNKKNRHSPTKPIGIGRTAAFPHQAQRVTAHTYLPHPYLVGTSPLPYLSTGLSQFSPLVLLTIIIAHLEGTRAGHILRVSFSFTAGFNLLERAILRPQRVTYPQIGFCYHHYVKMYFKCTLNFFPDCCLSILEHNTNCMRSKSKWSSNQNHSNSHKIELRFIVSIQTFH